MAELAIKIGLPARALEATVRTFNAACSQAKDFAYRRDDSAAVAAFERGEPFDWTGVMDGLATEGIEPGLGASERTPNAGVGIGDERAPTIEKVLYPASADVQFLRRQLFATPSRTSVLVLVSVLERRVVIRADVGLQDRVSVAEWDAVIARMVPALRDDAPGTALLAGLAAMREHFAGKGFQPLASGNRFADGPVEVRDP